MPQIQPFHRRVSDRPRRRELDGDALSKTERPVGPRFEERALNATNDRDHAAAVPDLPLENARKPPLACIP